MFEIPISTIWPKIFEIDIQPTLLYAFSQTFNFCLINFTDKRAKIINIVFDETRRKEKGKGMKLGFDRFVLRIYKSTYHTILVESKIPLKFILFEFDMLGSAMKNSCY